MVRSPEPIVSKTMGRGSHSGRTLAAILPSVLMLLILLMTSMIPLITYAQDTSMDSDAGDDGETYTVTYVNNYDQSQLKGIQNGSTAQDSLTVTYHGQAIAEYNPQFWNTCITGDVDGGVKPRNWFTMPDYNEIENTKTMVFVGWTHHEGWQDIEGGFGIASDWYNTEGNVVDPGDIIRFDEGNSTTLYAMWANINNLFFADDYIWGDPNKLGYSPDIFTGEPISFDDGCKYTNIVVLTRNVILGHNSTTGYILSLSSDATVGFTIRSMSGDEYLSICGDLDDDWSNDHYVAFTKVDLIIDNIGLVGHGYEDRPAYGLFANGNQIIIGANVSVQKRLDIYAGSWEGYEESDRRTDLRIFSGNYSNIYGASYIEASESFNVVLAGEASVNNIYGGGYDAVVTVELPISIHVIRATVRDDIYLGGRDVDDSNSSDVGTEGREHGLSLIVSDAAVGGSIYIGGQDERGQDGRAHLYASTIHLDVYGSKIGDSIWGGGRNAGTSCDELRILIVGSTVGTDGGADSGVFGEGTRYATAGVVGIDIRSGSSIHGLIRGNGGPIGIHGCDQSSGLLSIENASTLTLEDSSVIIHGSGHSLSGIGALVLNGGATLDLRDGISDVGSLGSYVHSDGQYVPATLDDCGTADGNSIILADGLILDLTRDGTYGVVTGYTLLQPAKLEMSVVLARGSIESAGGFAVEVAQGTVEMVPYTDGDGVRAWAYVLALELDDIPLEVIVVAVSEDDLADPIPVPPGYMVEGETFVSADGAIEATYADGAIGIRGLSEGTGAIGLVSDGWRLLIVISVASPEDVPSALVLHSDDDYSPLGEMAGNDLETRRI